MSLQYTKFVASKLMRAGFTDIKLLPEDETFGADITAISKKGTKLCIQCIGGLDVVTGDAVETISAAMEYYGCDGAMIFTSGTFSDKAIKKGAELHVGLRENFISDEMREEAERAAREEEREFKRINKEAKRKAEEERAARQTMQAIRVALGLLCIAAAWFILFGCELELRFLPV